LEGAVANATEQLGTISWRYGMENDHRRLAVVEDTREGTEMPKDEGKVTTQPVEKAGTQPQQHK